MDTNWELFLGPACSSGVVLAAVQLYQHAHRPQQEMLDKLYEQYKVWGNASRDLLRTYNQAILDHLQEKDDKTVDKSKAERAGWNAVWARLDDLDKAVGAVRMLEQDSRQFQRVEQLQFIAGEIVGELEAVYAARPMDKTAAARLKDGVVALEHEMAASQRFISNPVRKWYQRVNGDLERLTRVKESAAAAGH